MDGISANQFDEKLTKIAVSLYRHVFWADTVRKTIKMFLPVTEQN